MRPSAEEFPGGNKPRALGSYIPFQQAAEERRPVWQHSEQYGSLFHGRFSPEREQIRVLHADPGKDAVARRFRPRAAFACRPDIGFAVLPTHSYKMAPPVLRKRFLAGTTQAANAASPTQARGTHANNNENRNRGDE